MNPFWIIFDEIVFRPIFNLLIVFLEVFNWYLWLSIIALTLAVRLALLKTSVAQNDMQKQMTDLQPKMTEIQEKYKDDPEKQSREMMNLMKTQWGWPLKWCLMALLQMPVFLGLFFVIRAFAQVSKQTDAVHYDSLYSFFDFFGRNFFHLVDWVQQFNLEVISSYFLWIDLFASWNWLLAILSAVLMYIQMKMAMLNKPATPATMPWWAAMPDMSKMMWFMNIFLVFMIGSFVLSMPAWIGIYMVTTSLFSLIQTWIQYKEIIKVKIRALTVHH